MDDDWLEFIRFSSLYYHKSIGQTVFNSVPRIIRESSTYLNIRKRDKITKIAYLLNSLTENKNNRFKFEKLHLNDEQKNAAIKINSLTKPSLLQGVTGSGKTRVYGKIIQDLLLREPNSQVLLLCPEISLTPQLFENMKKMLHGFSVYLFHSEQTQQERAKIWLSSARGFPSLVIGTRISVFLPLPKLSLIIVDEEHDTSFKQQEGIRYSAKNLALWRAKKKSIKIVLGSATPSLESWYFCKEKKYERILLTRQANNRPQARIRTTKLDYQGQRLGISKSSEEKIRKTVSRKFQALIYINRKGWAPIIGCTNCGWAATCNSCSAHIVLHKILDEWKLICHHCGYKAQVNKHCPVCGKSELKEIGKGTEKIEETLSNMFPQSKILRMDRQKVKGRKLLEENLKKISNGEVDIVVGTQMITKGHDFPKMNFVVAVDVDSQLKNTDFRASERLFASLTQVAGRAGRHCGTKKNEAEFVVETRSPDNKFFGFLERFDTDGLYQQILDQRKAHNLPPFTNFASVKLSHKNEKILLKGLISLQETVQLFINQLQKKESSPVVNGPLPLYPEKISNKFRGQILLESTSRRDLHFILQKVDEWGPLRSKFNGFIDVDPIEF